MRHAETVTFGGSGLDRAAELRGDPAVLEAAVADAGAETILLWRGKLLVTGDDGDTLARLALDHPVLSLAISPPILLGRDNTSVVFACDISDWQPDGVDLSELDRFHDTSEQHHPDLPEDHRFAELRRIMVRLDARDAELATTAKALFGWHRSHRFCAVCGQESRMSQSGWQRGCAACGAQHFPRTDPVVIMLITHGNATLLGRSPGWPEGMYSCLAGFVEPGETLEAAVRREVIEEAGISVGAVRYLASQPWAFPSSLMIGCHGIASDTKITLDPVELEDARWVTREEVLRAMAGEHPGILPARKGAIAHFLLHNWLADTLD